MKRSVIISFILLINLGTVYSQKDSTFIHRRWYHPDYIKLQYAGEIGFVSLGLGKEIFKKKNGEIDLFGGYLPESIGGDNIICIAFKFNYMPWEKDVFNKKYKLEPLTIGVRAYHAFTKKLNEQKNGDLYPNGYYWWTLGTRFGPFFGSRITKEYDSKSFLKSLSLYMEIGTNDLYIYSWIVNRSTVPIYKIWNSSFGLKAKF